LFTPETPVEERAMPFSGVSLLSFPLVPGEQYEVYAVLITIVVSLALLVAFGQFWQR
jgi:hypothetical protein